MEVNIGKSYLSTFNGNTYSHKLQVLAILRGLFSLSNSFPFRLFRKTEGICTIRNVTVPQKYDGVFLSYSRIYLFAIENGQIACKSSLNFK